MTFFIYLYGSFINTGPFYQYQKVITYHNYHRVDDDKSWKLLINGLMSKWWKHRVRRKLRPKTTTTTTTTTTTNKQTEQGSKGLLRTPGLLILRQQREEGYVLTFLTLSLFNSKFEKKSPYRLPVICCNVSSENTRRYIEIIFGLWKETWVYSKSGLGRNMRKYIIQSVRTEYM